MKSVIIDYGLGNLFSLQRALAYLGHEAAISADPAAAARADRLFLPGVGAFPKAMKELAVRGLIDPVKAHAAAGKPLLGICLGMQILFSTSAEFGDHAGLGIIPGRVVRLASAPGFKVPQVGWNRAEPREPACAFWRESGRDFYFVHSFICQPEEPVDVAAQTEYGGELFCSVVNRGKIWGCQFHPERSGPDGLGFLRSFLAI